MSTSVDIGRNLSKNHTTTDGNARIDHKANGMWGQENF